MERLDAYTELEFQRRHLVDATEPKDRAMIMVGINRLLDSMLDESVGEILPSAEGQRHLDKHLERGRE